jgi:hypothetical protein
MAQFVRPERRGSMERDRKAPVATVNEEPASTETKSGRINQGGQEATRETGKRHTSDQAEQKADEGCGCA